MKQLFLLTFLPEPLYTVVMALTAVTLVVLFCLFMYAVMMRVLGSDFVNYTSYADDTDENENIDHLHREYYVQDNKTGNKYTIKTNPDGRIEKVTGNGYQVQPENSVYIVEKGTSCLMTDANGNVLKEYELAIRP